MTDLQKTLIAYCAAHGCPAVPCGTDKLTVTSSWSLKITRLDGSTYITTGTIAEPIPANYTAIRVYLGY